MKLMHFVIVIYVLIQFVSFNLKKSSAQNNEASILYSQFCENLDNAYKYRNTKDWQKFEKIEHQKMPTDKFDAINFSEWKILYESIRQFFDYCDFLKSYADSDLSHEDDYRREEFVHFAFKPQFFYPNDDTMPISDGMRKIVEGFNIILKNGLAKFNFLSKKELPQINFINRQICTKVLAWTYSIKKGENIQLAKTTLHIVKLHILLSGFHNFTFDLPYPPIDENEMGEFENDLISNGFIANNRQNITEDNNIEENDEELYWLWAYKMMLDSIEKGNDNKGNLKKRVLNFLKSKWL